MLSGLSGLAQAQTTFDVIGPHEYELPVGFEPFNVFVQYAYVQRNNPDLRWRRRSRKGLGQHRHRRAVEVCALLEPAIESEDRPRLRGHRP